MKKYISLALVLMLLVAIVTPAAAAPDKTNGYVPADDTFGAVATAVVTRLNGNQNGLTITVRVDGAVVAETYVLIRNNSAGEFAVGEYRVYVSTYGNDKIDHCFISFAPEPEPTEGYVPPTCTTEGYYWWKHENGNIFYHDYEPPLGHKFGDPIWDGFGWWSGACSECPWQGYLSYDKCNYGHTLVREIIDVTCEKDGETRDACSDCVFFDIIETVPATGHRTVPVLVDGLIHMVCQVADCTHDEELSGFFVTDWVGPGVSRPLYSGSAFIRHLPASPVAGDTVQNSRLYYPTGDNIPAELPLIVMYHGYETSGSNEAAINRNDYIGRHLAQQGFIVVIAAHQAGTSAAGGAFNGYMPNGANIINQTVAYLSEENATGIQLARDAEGQPIYGLMGYSMGGILAMNLASAWENGRTYFQYTTMFIINNSVQTQAPIPKPLFVYALELSSGGGTSNTMQSGSPIGNRGGYWADLDPDIYVVMTTGSALSNGDKDHALSCWNAIRNHPVENKLFIGWQSDPRAAPVPTAQRINANHAWPANWPATGNIINDGTMNALHFAMLRSVTSLANTRFFGTDDFDNYLNEGGLMGFWWDGVPIRSATLSREADMQRDYYWRQP